MSNQSIDTEVEHSVVCIKSWIMRTSTKHRLYIMLACIGMLIFTSRLINYQHEDPNSSNVVKSDQKKARIMGNIIKAKAKNALINTERRYVVEEKVENEDAIKSSRKKIIYTYGNIFGQQYWWDTPAGFDFTEPDGTACRYNHCKVVYDYAYLRFADAVLFHAHDVAPVKELKSLQIPLKQIWIWMTSESPYHYQKSKISFKDYHHVFNWTGTYRTDSKIWTPFYVIKPLKQSDPKPDINKDYAQGKSKMIIAIISNNCKSYRIDFIKKLKKHIDVDLYGNCKSEVNPDLPECPIHSKECEKLQSKYKFTLSLENAYCTDYVTEKFYINALKRGNVPIILNRGNMSNPNVAPPKSYINILDFKDIKGLAKYLKKVASDNTKYNEFHAWRRNYKVGTKNRMCTTCEQLWKREIQQNKKHESAKVEEFWNYEKNCVSYDNEMFQKYIR